MRFARDVSHSFCLFVWYRRTLSRGDLVLGISREEIGLVLVEIEKHHTADNRPRSQNANDSFNIRRQGDKRGYQRSDAVG